VLTLNCCGVEQFQLLAARRSKSSAKGDAAAKPWAIGGVADFRNYVAGDDFRYLDWNLYAGWTNSFSNFTRRNANCPSHFSGRQRVHDLRHAAEV